MFVVNEEEFAEALENVCEYAHICPTSDYGSLPECTYDKRSCNKYFEMRQTELILMTVQHEREELEGIEKLVEEDGVE